MYQITWYFYVAYEQIHCLQISLIKKILRYKYIFLDIKKNLESRVDIPISRKTLSSDQLQDLNVFKHVTHPELYMKVISIDIILSMSFSMNAR